MTTVDFNLLFFEEEDTIISKRNSSGDIFNVWKVDGKYLAAESYRVEAKDKREIAMHVFKTKESLDQYIDQYYNKEKNLNKRIEKMVNSFFIDIAENFELETGDVSPFQDLEIDKFKKLIKEYVKQNKGGN